MRATARWILVCLAGLTAIVGVVFAVNTNHGQSGNNVLATSTSVASTATNVVLQLITPIGWVSPTPVATERVGAQQVVSGSATLGGGDGAGCQNGDGGKSEKAYGHGRILGR